MAHAVMSMTAHGVEPPCDGCGRPHARGSQMTAYEYEDGEAAGWHCAQCVDRYKAAGVFDPNPPDGRPAMSATATKLQFPYEIRSTSGGRWVFRSNADGDFYIDDEYIGEAGPNCDELVRAIDEQHPIWPAGDCEYHGPLEACP